MNDKKINEINLLEQNMQNILLQKQLFQMELNETENALEEIENSNDEVYKIIGNLMLKSDKNKLKGELESKKRLLNLRINNLEKEEKSIAKKIESLRDDVIKKEKYEK